MCWLRALEYLSSASTETIHSKQVILKALRINIWSVSLSSLYIKGVGGDKEWTRYRVSVKCSIKNKNSCCIKYSTLKLPCNQKYFTPQIKIKLVDIYKLTIFIFNMFKNMLIIIFKMLTLLCTLNQIFIWMLYKAWHIDIARRRHTLFWKIIPN